MFLAVHAVPAASWQPAARQHLLPNKAGRAVPALPAPLCRPTCVMLRPRATLPASRPLCQRHACSTQSGPPPCSISSRPLPLHSRTDHSASEAVAEQGHK